MNSRKLIIEKNEQEILQIAEKTATDLKRDYNIVVSGFEGIPTITYEFFHQLIKYMGENPDVDGINFLELFGVDRDEENVNSLTFYPGPDMKLLIKSDDETEEN